LLDWGQVITYNIVINLHLSVKKINLIKLLNSNKWRYIYGGFTQVYRQPNLENRGGRTTTSTILNITLQWARHIFFINRKHVLFEKIIMVILLVLFTFRSYFSYFVEMLKGWGFLVYHNFTISDSLNIITNFNKSDFKVFSRAPYGASYGN
jgi:hypothetical protein